MWFPTRSDTKLPVQSQKTARSLKFRIMVEEELYYPSGENKGTDQLRSYCEADLRLCFRLDRLLVFPCGGSLIDAYYWWKGPYSGTGELSNHDCVRKYDSKFFSETCW